MNRVPRVVVSLLALVSALVTVLLPAAPASAMVHAYATTTHPFSAPVWFPLANASVMSCMWDNPGCPPAEIQKYWGWDIGAQREPVGEFHQKVYAMGAGIVHVIADHQGCGGNDEKRGNVLVVDHGGGVISMYSHLADHFLVKNGDYVSARTPIAHVGNSGYKMCHEKPNVRFLAIVVKRDARRAANGGMTGTYTQVTHTYACLHGQRVDWPQQLPGHDGQGWSRWHSVPVDVPIPANDPDRSCIPPPATASMPRDAKLSREAKTALVATWSPAAARYHVGTVRVMLQEFHPSISKWLPLFVRSLDGTATRAYFAHLDVHYTFRVRMWFGNNVGWSRASPWQQRSFPH